MDIYAQIAERIIRGQETIIGPVAVEQARRVSNISIDWDKHEIEINGNEPKAIDELIAVYRELFGQVSVEVSKEAAATLLGKLSPAEVPETLK